MTRLLRCTATKLTLRTKPGGVDTGARIAQGQTVTAYGESYDRGWVWVIRQDGATGWASTAYLVPVTEPAGLEITPALTPVNHSNGRGGHRIDAVVMHISEGTLQSMTGWFHDPASRVSAHYGIGHADGRILQYVDDADTAQHAGLVVRPTAALVLERPGVNPNLWSIGVEHEGHATDDPAPAQVQASARLLRWLSGKHGFPLDRRHVIRHHEVREDKPCPGKLPVDEIVRLAREL